MKDVCNYSFGSCKKREAISLTTHAGFYFVRINGRLYARTDSEQKGRMCAEAIIRGYEIGRESTKTTGVPKF